jgi:hypothetical protein
VRYHRLSLGRAGIRALTPVVAGTSVLLARGTARETSAPSHEMSDCANNEFIAFYFDEDRASEGQLRRAAEQIEEHTPYRVCDFWLSPRRRVGVLNLCVAPPVAAKESLLSRLRRDWLANRPQTNRLRVREELAIVHTGYTTTPERVLERSLREDGNRLSSADAGGIAAFCLVRFGGSSDERLFVWSTRPSLRVVAAARAPQGWVLGTRPRLVHALTRAFQAPSLDLGYVRAVLSGWSLADHTPYEGTSLLPVDMLWRVQSGTRTTEGHPTAPFQREQRSIRRQRVLYRDALRSAVEPLRSLRGFELRLSGGKDSRLMAAVIAERGILPSTVICQGPPDLPEVRVAREVATRLGWSLKQAQPEFGYRGGMFATARYNLALADGFFATEPRHIGFPVHSLVGDAGPGLVVGHMELQKGGWAKTPKDTREGALALCRRKVARLRGAIAPELTEAAHRMVDEYADTVQPEDPAEYGYLLNYRFRVGRWLTSHMLSHSKEFLPVYPLVEEKVTRVVSCAPFWHLTSERLLADTTWDVAPMLRDQPLLGPPYRFVVHRQRAARAKQQAAQSPRALAPASVAPEPPPPRVVEPAAPAPAAAPSADRWLDARGTQFMIRERAQEICAHIRGGKIADELRALLLPAAWAVIAQPTYESMLGSGLSSVLLNELLFTCYQASVLHTDGLDSW